MGRSQRRLGAASGVRMMPVKSTALSFTRFPGNLSISSWGGIERIAFPKARATHRPNFAGASRFSEKQTMASNNYAEVITDFTEAQRVQAELESMAARGSSFKVRQFNPEVDRFEVACRRESN